MSSTPSNSPTRTKRNAHRQHARRWVPWLGAAILLSLIVAGLWPHPVKVETIPVTTGPLRATVNEEGKTRIRQRYLVSAPVSGQLRRIALKPGAEVVADQTVLAYIDPLSPSLLDARAQALASAKRETAAASLEKARAAQAFAANELKRFDKLFKGKTTTIQELEIAQWKEAAAAREVTAAEGVLRQVEAELAEFPTTRKPPAGPGSGLVEVRAPIGGRVLRVFEESARVVASGAQLLEVGNPADLEVVIEVLSKDGAAIPAGSRVELEHWGGLEPLEGRVRLIEPAAFTKVSALGVEEQRVRVVADLTSPLEKRGNLGDNFRVEARIVLWETDRALKVPAGALFRKGPDWAAYVLANDRAALRMIKTGRSSGTETQVLEGIKEGEEVILYPGDRVNQGTRVQRIKI